MFLDQASRVYGFGETSIFVLLMVVFLVVMVTIAGMLFVGIGRALANSHCSWVQGSPGFSVSRVM